MHNAALKRLKTDAFMAPNPVLCYGGGEAFQRIAPSMLSRGINIVGVIDAKRRGIIIAGDMELPLFTIAQAMKTYGTRVIIIVTIANEQVFQQVKQNLVESGFSGEFIFDLNVWTWLTVPSEKIGCEILNGSMYFYAPAIAKCCLPGLDEPFFCEWFLNGRSVRQSVDNSLEKFAYYATELKEGRIPLYCKDCKMLSAPSNGNGPQATFISISDHAFCNADCVYCEYACSAPRMESVISAQERYAASVYMLEQLWERKMLDGCSCIRFEGGEITANPYKEKLYACAKQITQQFPNIQFQILSNGFIYDQEIADLLLLGRNSYLMCDLDAGTPETYIKVKGFNKFSTVCENLKKYAQYGTIKLKYIVLPNWNDSQADYEGIIALIKELNVSELILSLEFGLSRTGNRMDVREALYAVARLMVLLKENGIEAVLPDAFWKREDAVVAKRLCHEIHSLCEG